MPNKTKDITQSVKGVFSDFISTRVPQKISNVLWGLYTGVTAAMEHLEWKIDTMIRERNILTATHKSSLRSLAAENGFEPKLRTPSQGLIKLTINQALYNRVGYPLFIPPYAEFKCKENGMTYYYDSDTALRLVGSSYKIPVVEGEIKNMFVTATGESIQRIYLSDDTIANNSISVYVGDDRFVEVKSFFDNMNLNDNKQFIVKFSHNPQTPIIIYLKGANNGDSLKIEYRTTYGEYGNITEYSTFETNDIINKNGDEISVSDDEMLIDSSFGFNLGSNGTDINAMKAAIGYNHGSSLLFDTITYKNFINGFSTLLLQNIFVDPNKRSVNRIFVSKKQCLNLVNASIESEYKKVVENNLYVLSEANKKELSNILSEHEHCLSSHEIYDALVCKYAFQIMFDTVQEKDYHQSRIASLIYKEFAQFLYDKSHVFYIDDFIHDYEVNNNINLDYYVFKSVDDGDSEKRQIKHADYLPVLQGNFDITTDDGNTVQLFADINFVVRN